MSTTPICHCDERQAIVHNENSLFTYLEKISAVALGVFALMNSAPLFISFFLLGIGVRWYQIRSGDCASVNRTGSSCSQGFLEQVTGIRLPPLISFAANLAVIWCHIEHHPTIFVPIVGISLGAWAGQHSYDLSLRCSTLFA